MMNKKIAVIGAGTMGVDLCIDLILHEFTCVLIDISNEILINAKNEVLKKVRTAAMFDKSLPTISESEIEKKIIFSQKLNDVAECDLVIENVTEDWNIKEDIYRKLVEICKSDTKFAVNTSCISITKISGLVNNPENVIGIHFMNPVYLKKSVEVIKGFYTSEESIQDIKEFLEKLGKGAIVVNDFPGFVSNRISHLYMNEAAYVIQDGVASVAQVDMIFKKCYGHKMGPLETADLIGLDTVVKSLDVLFESYKDPKFRCCPLLRKMVDAKLLGRKSGEGFYKY